MKIFIGIEHINTARKIDIPIPNIKPTTPNINSKKLEGISVS